MKIFTHYVRGGDELEDRIIVQDGTRSYQDLPTNFALDYGSSAPSLPEDAVAREYTVVRHVTWDETGTNVERSIPWNVGDAIIATLDNLLEAQALRRASEFPPLPSDVPTARAEAKRSVDMKAGEVRARFITPDPGQEMTYVKKEQEAEAFKTAGYPAEDLADYPFIKAEAEATDDTGQQAADAILVQRDLWLIAGAAIEKERRLGKITVDQQLGVEGVYTARDNAVAALNAITP